MFAQYKGDEGLSSTNVQGDLSVIGEEFVNFITTILTSRMAKKADEAGLLDTMSYGELMNDLSSAWRSVKGESVKPKDNDRYWIHTLPSVMKSWRSLISPHARRRKEARKTQEGKVCLRCTQASQRQAKEESLVL